MDNDNLRKLNAMMGIGITNLNINYDEEDAEMFDKIITSKVSDLPQLFYSIFNALIPELPKEIQEKTVGELFDYLTEYLSD